MLRGVFNTLTRSLSRDDARPLSAGGEVFVEAANAQFLLGGPAIHTNVSQVIDDYDAWNAAIYAHFFGPSKKGADVRLTFDDVTAAQVAEKLDATVEDFIACIRGLVRPYLRDVFLKFRELSSRSSSSPGTLGLLAGQVLVASRMASDSDFTAGAFWPRFNALFLSRADTGQPGG